MSGLHAHMVGRSRDCDGDYTRSHVYEMTTLEKDDPQFGELRFQQRVVANTISLHSHGLLDVTPESVGWFEETEEGYRAAEVRWCNEECPQERTWQRDHRAEEAGY